MFLVCLAGIIGAIGYGIALLLMRRDGKIKDRLAKKQDAGVAGAIAPQASPSLAMRIGTAASKPFVPKDREKQSSLRRKLAHAGITSKASIQVFIGARMICLIALGAVGYMLGVMFEADLAGLFVGSMIGYFLPALWLRMRVGRNHKLLARGLPDALDLMVVCVEAGLTMEAAMQRVGQELVLPHPALARELGITHMETQMGVPRSEALRNLAGRSGSPEVKGLTAMLIQAEKLGTSIGRALRVHAESLRLKRQYAAQETAAKASVKLIFPVAMLIFPATIVVLIGPAIIQMIESGFFNGTTR